MLLTQFQRAHVLLVMHTTCTILSLGYLTDNNHSPLLTIVNVCFGIHANMVSMLICTCYLVCVKLIDLVYIHANILLFPFLRVVWCASTLLCNFMSVGSDTLIIICKVHKCVPKNIHTLAHRYTFVMPNCACAYASVLCDLT